MNQSDTITIRYAVAGLGVLALLILVGWLALREPAEERPVTVATASPHVLHITPPSSPANDAQRETPASQAGGTLETNAAVIYRQAFALYDALPNEQKEVISDWRTDVDVSVEAELCEKIQPICELMHQAAALTNCDWGVDQPITSETRLLHLSQSRLIARAAVWSAAHCRTDEPLGAVDDLVAASRLGQNMSPSLIGHLMDLAIQNMVIDTVTAHASILAGADNSRLVQLLSDAQHEEGLYRAIEEEANLMSAEADKLAAMPPEQPMREPNGEAGGDSGSHSMDLVQVIAAMRQAADLEREYTKVLGASDAEYREWLARLEAARKTNQFIDNALPVIEKAADQTQAVTVKSAMITAGLAVMQSGPDALQSHLDPFTGQPFVYTKTDGGFQLQSSYQFKGAPLTLSFK